MWDDVLPFVDDSLTELTHLKSPTDEDAILCCEYEYTVSIHTSRISAKTDICAVSNSTNGLPYRTRRRIKRRHEAVFTFLGRIVMHYIKNKVSMFAHVAANFRMIYTWNHNTTSPYHKINTTL
jgi:hypothetical protein